MRVDIHCHTFNASDLSVEKFLYNAILDSDEPDGNAFKVLVAPLSKFLAALVSDAPTAAEEDRFLDSLSRPQFVNFNAFAAIEATRAQTYVTRVAEALKQLDESGDAEDRALLKRLKAESRANPEPKGNAGEVFGFAPRAELVEADPFGKLAENILGAPGAVSRFIQWAHLFRKYRYRITEELIRIYGGGDDGIDLFTPLLVDYAFWLDQEPKTPIREQIDIFSRLAKVFPGKLHPFVAFDPGRQTVVPHGPDSPFEMVKEAISSKGFIGIKLYPPMGFKAYGNANPGDPLDSLGNRLDKALLDLYKWAEEQGVPIIAHCSPSNFNRAEDQLKASPKYWAQVLAICPKLRLNLGHFGGDGPIGKAWANTICGLLRQYEHVYADVGYYNNIATDKGRNEILADFKNWREGDKNSPPYKVEDKILFGTDWIMLAREAGANDYVKRFSEGILATPDDGFHDKFFGRNALRYLGIAPGGQTLTRLEEFYRVNEIPRPTWLVDAGTPVL